jgi:hypothetical protein
MVWWRNKNNIASQQGSHIDTRKPKIVDQIVVGFSKLSCSIFEFARNSNYGRPKNAIFEMWNHPFHQVIDKQQKMGGGG